jgi:hypothetical protein
MKEARKADDGRTIRDDETWTLEDYRDFMFCVENGYLVQDMDTCWFIINEVWDREDIYAEAFGDIECEDCGDEGSVSGSPDGKLCPDCYDEKEEEEEEDVIDHESDIEDEGYSTE